MSSFIKKFFLYFIILIFLVDFIGMIFLLAKRETRASILPVRDDELHALELLRFEIDVENWIENMLGAEGIFELLGVEMQEEVKEQKEKIEQSSFWGIGKALLTEFLNKLAYETAVWIVSGDEGQKPKFFTDQYDEYLRDAADVAVGRYIDAMAAGKFGEKFNLCEPDFSLKLSVALGLQEYVKPKAPTCSWRKMKANWEEEINNMSFLRDFQAYFNPWENDVGIGLGLYSGMAEVKEEEEEAAKLNRQEGGGFKAVTDTVSGLIETPGILVGGLVDSILGKGGEQTLTGDIFADAIGTFTSTLAGKQLEEWFIKGMAHLNQQEEDEWNYGAWIGISSDEESVIYTGKAGAKARFAEIITPEVSSGGAYTVLAKISSCVSPDNPGPEECVIDGDFRQAIENKTLVKNLEQKLLDRPFGRIPEGLEVDYKVGYSYRNLVILRKYRIVPVGWELAAQYIKEFDQKTYTLGDLIELFDDSSSSFYGLVDPDWVLKAPEVYCRRQGAGSIINSESISGGRDSNQDGDYEDEGEVAPERIISRKTDYCADEQSCVAENDDGTCRFYGYCQEEKREWNFNGSSCEEQYNSCQTFQSQEGGSVSYLKNSLDYSNCSSDNAGCEWYCEEYNPVSAAWRCAQPDYILEECQSGKVGWNDADNGCRVTDSATGENCLIPRGGIECITETSAIKLTLNSLIYDEDSEIYFDSDIEKCSSEDEGCQEFIRTKAGLGTNLLLNSSFEEIDEAGGDKVDDGVNDTFLDWQTSQGDAVSTSFFGGKALEIKGNLTQSVETGWEIKYRSFVLSFYIKDKDTKANLTCGGSGNTYSINEKYVSGSTATLEDSEDWRKMELVYNFPYNAYGSEVAIEINGTNCLIDGLQFEEGTQTSGYKEYGETNKVYLKLAPSYYDCEGYNEIIFIYDKEVECENDGYYWRSDWGVCVKSGRAECDNFVPFCTEEEVGCEAYTPVNGDPLVPAVATINDYCPAECEGYQTYKQEGTYFEKENYPLYFIASTASACSASQAGCDEFTNLDEVAKGGEGREYYSYLRHCIKPSEESCATFYTWIGSENSGYQLKTYYLQDSDANSEPDEVGGLTGKCSKPEDAIQDPECKEFYSAGGKISYHFYKNTVSCSDDCHPYRRTSLNLDSAYTSESSCEAASGDWIMATDTTNGIGACTFCSLFGGEFKNYNDGVVGNEECIYYAIPEEGISCSAAFAGCREYKGDAAGNVYKVFEDDFEEEEETEYWNAFGGLSTEALTVGNHSLAFMGEVQKEVLSVCSLPTPCDSSSGCNCYEDNLAQGEEVDCVVSDGEERCTYLDLIEKGKTYLLSFWLKSTSAGSNFTVKFTNAPQAADYFMNNFPLNDTEWHNYELGPVFVSWDPGDAAQSPAYEELLEFTISSWGAFIDKVVLKEVDEDIFVIKDSWQTPDSCDEDPYGGESPQYMLGCEEYTDPEGGTFYLKSFTNLCREESVGCEALIDTHNSNSPREEIFNEGRSSEIIVPEDKIIYAVNDNSKNCQESYQGCQAVGLPTLNVEDEVTSYETQYYLNDPDNYQTILCNDEAVDCQEYTSADGTYYFRDPGDKVCEYKIAEGQSSYGWYRKGTTSSSPDCPLISSQLDIDYPAMGVCRGGDRDGQGCRDFGVYNGECSADGYCEMENWVGFCPATASGCTEYIDPLSDIGQDLVFNGNFEQDVDANSKPDGWNEAGTAIKSYTNEGIESSKGVKLIYDSSNNLTQTIKIEPRTIYTLSGFAKCGSSCDSQDALMVFEANTGCGDAGTCPAELISPDGSLKIENQSRASLLLARDKFSSSYFRSSGRFYSEEAEEIKLGFGSNQPGSSGQGIWFDEVSLRETGVYYNLRGSVDTETCNGLVSFADGCVLFNDRGAIDYSQGKDEDDNSYLIYDADESPLDSGIPASDCKNASNNTLCDSNLLLKVTPDRDCGVWLYCQSSTQYTDQNSGQTQNICLNVGLCNSLDEQGNCDGFPLGEEQKELTYNSAEAAKLRDLTGYNKIGMSWSTGEIEGYYPFYAMPQEGGEVEASNLNFEVAYDNGQPSAWELEELSWAPSYFKVVDDPVEAQKELGENYLPPEGNNFLKLNSAYQAISELLEVSPDSEYVISAYINTINLDADYARIYVTEFNEDGSAATGGEFDLVPEMPRLAGGENWTFKVGRFRTGGETRNIRIKLFNDGGSLLGSSYFDDIKLRSALKVKDDFYLTPSCRLYAKADSPSCNYLDEGFFYRGWSGYCLERDPANLSNCLLWYPVDMIAGEGLKAMAGYQGRAPLYYCLNLNNDTSSKYYGEVKATGNYDRTCLSHLLDESPENRGNVVYFSSPEVRGIYKHQIKEIKVYNSWMNREFTLKEDSVYPWEDGHYYYEPGGSGASWWMGEPERQEYSRRCLKKCWDDGLCHGKSSDDLTCRYDEDNYCIDEKYIFYTWVEFTDEEIPRLDKIYYAIMDNSTKVEGVSDTAKFYIELYDESCSMVAQVVNPQGGNKAFVGRVGTGSSYLLPGINSYVAGELNYSYLNDYESFGSIIPPEPQNNPYNWDSRGDERVCTNDHSISCENDEDCSENEEGAGYCENLYVDYQPLYWEYPLVDDEDYEEPYQARSGSFYGCSSGSINNCYIFGSCSTSGNICVYNEDCSSVEDCLKGRCEDSPTLLCDENSDCSTGDCLGNFETTTSTSEETATKAAQELLRHLFAKSYGVWQWSTNVCKGGQYDGEPCLNSEDCQADADGICSETSLCSQPDPYLFCSSGCPTDYVCDPNGSGNCVLECIYDDEGGDVCSQTQTYTDASGNTVTYNYGACNKTAGGLCVGGGDIDGQPCSCDDYITYTDPETGTTYEVCDSDDCVNPEGDGSCNNSGGTSGHYLTVTGYDWTPSNSRCAGNTRPTYDSNDPAGDLCGVIPLIGNIKVNNSQSNVEVSNSGYITLKFTSDVNSDQMPLTAYRVDWSDGTKSTVSGLKINDLSSPDNPHILYHSYGYWDLLGKSKKAEFAGLINCDTNCQADGYCQSNTNAYCVLKPKIQIQDNWGWCSDDNDDGRGVCGNWEPFGGNLVLTEK